MRRLTAGLLAPLMALAAATADAETGRGVTAADVVTVLQAMELEPELHEDGTGDPLIQFRINDLTAYMNFYDCSAGRCGSLQIEVGLDLEHGTSLQVANLYNSRYRYGRMRLDDEMDPYLHYDFEVLYSSHAAHIRSQVGIFGQLLEDFTRAVDF